MPFGISSDLDDFLFFVRDPLLLGFLLRREIDLNIAAVRTTLRRDDKLSPASFFHAWLAPAFCRYFGRFKQGNDRAVIFHAQDCAFLATEEHAQPIGFEVSPLDSKSGIHERIHHFGMRCGDRRWLGLSE